VGKICRFVLLGCLLHKLEDVPIFTAKDHGKFQVSNKVKILHHYSKTSIVVIVEL
jgi:hypothetical protein